MQLDVRPYLALHNDLNLLRLKLKLQMADALLALSESTDSFVYQEQVTLSRYQLLTLEDCIEEIVQLISDLTSNSNTNTQLAIVQGRQKTIEMIFDIYGSEVITSVTLEQLNYLELFH